MAINGLKFKEMCVSGANALDNSKEEINNLNVFPVPDGDTGINMSLTLSEIASVNASESISDVAAKVASSVMRSARGNSGAILALFFRGISKSLSELQEATASDFAKAFKKGTEEAYKAVMDPKEGTILTVMRCASEYVFEETSKPDFDIDENAFLKMFIKKAEETLELTPELLPVLKQANVVDAGGAGFVTMFKGMRSYLKGKPVEKIEADIRPINNSADFSEFNTEDIKFAYCTECIVDKKAKYLGEGTAKEFYEYIITLGDSAVFIDDDEIIKLHVHTNNPGLVLEKALKFGSLAKVKIENMKNQHSELAFEAPAEPKEPPKPFGFVSVCVGGGVESVFLDLGADYIVKGGQSMNPSTQDIVDAIKAVNAETVFVFPNNKNIDMVAKQASDMISDKKVVVISTKTVPQGITSLMVFDETLSAKENEDAMYEAMKTVKTISVTHAVRDATINNVNISVGQALGLVDGKIRMVNDSSNDCIKYLADHYRDASYITIFYGEDISEKKAEKLQKTISKIAQEAEISLINGGQPLYDYIISVE